MLSPGINSYVSLEEANLIVNEYFTSTDDARVAWQTKSDSDKEALLIASCASINNLKLAGRRAKAGQKLEFPRVRSFICGVAFRPFISQYEDNSLVDGGSGDGGMEQVRIAQVKNAAYGALLGGERSAQMKRNIMGLTSKKAGPIAESYGNAQYNAYNKDLMVGIYTQEVYTILTPWVNTSRGGL